MERQWEEATKTKRTKILTAGLKPGTVYHFQITATNDLIKSMPATGYSWTQESKAKVVAISGTAACTFSLILFRITVASLIERMKNKELS